VNVDGGAETGTAVGGAGGDVAEMIIVLEFHLLFDVASSGNKALEHLEKGGALLHRNDAEMVFLVYPHKEGLVLVVVNATVLGPVAVQVASFEETVSLLE
jgi:ethanolamine utilization microcompartment shell protein EutL